MSALEVFVFKLFFSNFHSSKCVKIEQDNSDKN